MTVGERIKQKRIELNMTQDELAKKVGYKSRSSFRVNRRGIVHPGPVFEVLRRMDGQ